MADLTTELTGLRRSPLAHLTDRLAAASDPSVVSLAEVPFVAMVSLRVDPETPAAARVAAVLGAPLPTACGEVTGTDSHDALWLGPDEWLVVASHRSGRPGRPADRGGRARSRAWCSTSRPTGPSWS